MTQSIAIHHCLGVWSRGPAPHTRITLVLQDAAGRMHPLEMDLPTALAVSFAIRAYVSVMPAEAEPLAEMMVWHEGAPAEGAPLMRQPDEPAPVGGVAALQVWISRAQMANRHQRGIIAAAFALAALVLALEMVTTLCGGR